MPATPSPIPSPRPSPRPELSEVVNGATGTVTASGHLTSRGADLLRGTVEGLRRRGHSTVVLDLADVRAVDTAGLLVLEDLGSAMAGAGSRLVVQHAPPRPGTAR
jgi:anti-anti-sigma regulatory factor